MLRKELKLQRVSQKAIATRANVSSREVSAYVRDKFKMPGHPNADTLYQIAEALGFHGTTILDMANLKFTDGVMERIGKKEKTNIPKQGISDSGSSKNMATSGNILSTIRNRPGSLLHVTVIKEIAKKETATFDLAFVNLIAKQINSRWEIRPDECQTEEEEINHLRRIDGSCD